MINLSELGLDGRMANMNIQPLLDKADSTFLPGIGWAVADHAKLKSLAPGIRHDGMEVLTRNDNAYWLHKETGVEVDTTENLAIAPSSGTGSWIRLDKSVDLKLPFDFNTADAGVLFTVPVGMRIAVRRTLWEIIVSMTGGTTPAIGLSSSNAGFNTKGDLQGGAPGDLTAALTAGIRPGTLGTKFGSNGFILLVAGDTIRFDRIANAFTAGSGFAHLLVDLMS